MVNDIDDAERIERLETMAMNLSMAAVILLPIAPVLWFLSYQRLRIAGSLRAHTEAKNNSNRIIAWVTMGISVAFAIAVVVIIALAE